MNLVELFPGLEPARNLARYDRIPGPSLGVKSYIRCGSVVVVLAIAEARKHRPEICFPAAGYQPCGDDGIMTVEAKGFSIPFHALDFADGGSKEYVFFCLWEEGFKSSDSNWATTRLAGNGL